ncbi:MAG: type II secretion system F family protein [Candidatus Gracilibacteria bacterium]|nr:type II secretion system F family protein [Candidatus Gracilibacteria bacterium]
MADFLILDDDNKKLNVDNNVNNVFVVKNVGLVDKINELIISLQKVKTSEKVIFYRLLSTMTNAGMGLMKSVSIIERQEKNPVFKRILLKFVDELKEGKSLSECMLLYPQSFGEAEIGIIRSGEKTGQINKVLNDLAVQIEKVESISGKIKSAMMYPMFIIVVVIGVIAVMMTMVVPKLLGIFDSKDDLPGSTKILIYISDAFVNYWLIMVITVIVAFILISIWKKTDNGKYIYDNLKLKIPIFGMINQKLILSKFSRVFSGLISSGVSIVESLKITSYAVGNEVYKQKILLLSEDIAGGIKMWESLDGDKLFPDMMVQMIQVGEQTARLDQTILKVADFYDEQVDNTIGVLNKLLEPFILVTLAIVVGFIAVAIMQPIMGLADTISQA